MTTAAINKARMGTPWLGALADLNAQAPMMFLMYFDTRFAELVLLRNHYNLPLAGLMAASESTAIPIDLAITTPTGRHPVRGPSGLVQRFLRATIHFFSYHLVMRRRSSWRTKVAGLQFVVRPTVFHPGYFISSERFANFIDRLDLRGKRVLDVGTGSGILAIAAARSGAPTVIATDINPNAALSVPENAQSNGVRAQVQPVCMDLLSGFVSGPEFDVIFANLPKHNKQPRDLADRGWHSGPKHRDIAPFFAQAYERLRLGGCLYVMLSSHSDLDVIESLISLAGFQWKIIQRYPIFIESFVLYECRR